MVIPGISRSSQLAAVGAVVFTLVLQVHAATALERVEVGKWQSGDPCPDVLVLGARGSGQEDGAGGVSPGSPTLGVGEEVYRFAGYLAGVLEPEGLAVAVLPNAYPAVPLDEAVGGDPDYFDSVEMGAVAVEIYVALVASQCGEGTRVVVALAKILDRAHRDGALSIDTAEVEPGLAADFERIRGELGLDLPAPLLARGVLVWSSLFGAVNFEVFGPAEVARCRGSWSVL